MIVSILSTFKLEARIDSPVSTTTISLACLKYHFNNKAEPAPSKSLSVYIRIFTLTI